MIEGFSNFLQAVPFSTLRTAAAEGPVILINISIYRSDAIIIHIDKPPILVALPKATSKHLTDLGEQLASALAVTNSSNLLLPMLRDLWNYIVSPVCDSLSQYHEEVASGGAQHLNCVLFPCMLQVCTSPRNRISISTTSAHFLIYQLYLH